MNNKHNSYCAICGKSYYYCHSCKDQARLHPYRIHTDTSEHFKIFTIVRGYNVGLYSKEEAYNLLKKVDISDKDSYKDNIKLIIDEILNIEEKVDIVPETPTSFINNENNIIPTTDKNIVKKNNNIYTKRNKKQFRYNKNDK